MTKQNEILTHERQKKIDIMIKHLKRKGYLCNNRKKINTILPDIHCEYPL